MKTTIIKLGKAALAALGVLCMLVLFGPHSFAQSDNATSAVQTVTEIKTTTASAERVPRRLSLDDLSTSPTPGGDDDGLIRLNFKDAALSTVLDYLSKSAGFAIVLEAKVEGKVDAWSHKPLTKAEAVDLLSTVLYDKGFAVIQNGRILKIVPRGDAKTSDLEVKIGANPAEIPKSDRIVHQIIPVRSANAMQLIKNLQELLPDDAVITANESSNAIILTATESTINRMTHIIAALDTSIAEISDMRVFRLKYADATELAKIITSIFASPTGGANNNRGGDPGRNMAEMMRRRFGGDQGGGGNNPNEETGVSAARSAASRIVAVADTRNNALVVTAATELMPSIEALILQMDVPSESAVELKIFPLQYADASEVSNAVTQIFGDGTSAGSQGSSNRNPRMPWDRGGRDSAASQGADRTEKTLMEAKVAALPDTRTNSVIVTASANALIEIGAFINRLDVQSDTIGKIVVYPLQFADSEEMATVINTVFKSGGSTSTSGGGGFGGRGGFRGQPTQSSTTKATRGAADLVEVTAVADTRTNSVIVSAADGMHPQIEELIKSIDTSAVELAELKVFALKYADAEETAALITSMFKDDQSQQQNSRGNQRGGRFGGQQQTQSATGQRRLEEQLVVATADIRTNSVIVSASKGSLEEIEKMIVKLDSDPSRKQKVFIYPIKNTDAEELQLILESMFSGSGTSSSRSRTSSSSSRNSSSNSGFNAGSSSNRGSSRSSGGSSSRGGF